MATLSKAFRVVMIAASRGGTARSFAVRKGDAARDAGTAKVMGRDDGIGLQALA